MVTEKYQRTRKASMEELCAGWSGERVGKEWGGPDVGDEAVMRINACQAWITLCEDESCSALNRAAADVCFGNAEVLASQDFE